MDSKMTSSPTTIQMVWAGGGERYPAFPATTVAAAQQEIGKRAAEGNPLVNPEIVEMAVVGDPSPNSIEGLIGGLTSAFHKAADQFNKNV